jgi:hypothetical protein
MPKTTLHVNRVLRSPQVLEAIIDIVRRHLPLALQNTRITEEDILYMLTHASVHRRASSQFGCGVCGIRGRTVR